MCEQEAGATQPLRQQMAVNPPQASGNCVQGSAIAEVCATQCIVGAVHPNFPWRAAAAHP